MICRLCPRNCGAERTEFDGNGVCGMGTLPVVARAALHFWEEPDISGTRGSGAVFFSGCALNCVFCQNAPISTERFGKPITVRQLADIFYRLEQQGAHNINLVNPTHFVPAIIEALRLYRPSIPILYNCGGYERAETLKSLKGLIDIYLPDLKYGRAETAKRYANAPDYFETATKAICEMLAQQPELVHGEDGMLQKGVVIRHRVLPGHVHEACGIMDWIKQHAPGAAVSLMGQYLPCGRANEFPELNRRLTAREYDRAMNHFLGLEFENGNLQQPSSAKKDYIPDFNLEGVE